MLALGESVRNHRGPVLLHRNQGSRCTTIMHVAWFFSLPIKADVLLLFFGQIVQGEPIVLRDGRGAPACTFW